VSLRTCLLEALHAKLNGITEGFAAIPILDLGTIAKVLAMQYSATRPDP